MYLHASRRVCMCIWTMHVPAHVEDLHAYAYIKDLSHWVQQFFILFTKIARHADDLEVEVLCSTGSHHSHSCSQSPSFNSRHTSSVDSRQTSVDSRHILLAPPKRTYVIYSWFGYQNTSGLRYIINIIFCLGCKTAVLWSILHVLYATYDLQFELFMLLSDTPVLMFMRIFVFNFKKNQCANNK